MPSFTYFSSESLSVRSSQLLLRVPITVLSIARCAVSGRLAFAVAVVSCVRLARLVLLAGAAAAAQCLKAGSFTGLIVPVYSPSSLII